MTNDWLTEWHWPQDLRAQRWLLLGTDAAQLGVTATARGAAVTALPLDEVQWWPHAEVVVAQQLFMNIRHPLWWLEKLCASTRAEALLHCAPLSIAGERALLAWNEPSGWRTNRTALARLARSAGFARVEVLSESADHIWLKAARHWHDFPADATPTMTIRRALNPATGQAVFPRNGRHACAVFFVEGLPAAARRWEVRVSIDSLGVQPLRVMPATEDDCMQINLALPPGLRLGSATVELWYRQQRAAPYAIDVCEGTQW